MGGFSPAGRMGDNVTLPDGMRLLADPHLTLALKHDEHFLIDAMVVEWPGAFAGRHDGQVAPELLRANPAADVANPGGEFLRRMFRTGGAVADLAEFDISDVEDGLRHGGFLQCGR